MHFKKEICRLLLMGLAMSLIWMPVMVSPCHGMLAVLSIDHFDPEDITRAVSVLLSPEGRLSFDRRTRALIVNDTPQIVAQVKAMVRRLDHPTPGLIIRVRLGHSQLGKKRAIEAKGRLSGSGWSVGSPGREEDGLDLTLDETQSDSRRQSEIVVRGQPGRPAYIATGRDIPFTTRWMSVCKKYGGCRKQTVYKRVETGFEVLPVVRGRRVQVNITPCISSYESGLVRFAGAAVQVLVPLGRWVDIGRVTGDTNEAVRAIIDSGRGDSRVVTSIWMRIEPVAP